MKLTELIAKAKADNAVVSQELGKYRELMQASLAQAIQRFMRQYKEDTGLPITSISIELIQHYHGLEPDESVLLSVHLRDTWS